MHPSKMQVYRTQGGRVALDIVDNTGARVQVLMSDSNAQDLMALLACALPGGLEDITDRIIRMFLAGAAVYTGIMVEDSDGDALRDEEMRIIGRWAESGTHQEPEDLRKVLEMGYRRVMGESRHDAPEGSN